MGTKSSDRETMPLCFKHHRAFHDANGPFEYLTRKERRTWQELQVQQCQDLYDLQHSEPHVLFRVHYRPNNSFKQ